MREQQIENVVGAWSLALADNLIHTAQQHVSPAAPAAAITLVGHVPGLTIRQFSRALGLSHPGAVRLVDRLVAADMVRRGHSEQDGRAVTLTLTPQGEVVCGQILLSRQTALNRALALLSPAERQTLGQLAQTMLCGMVGGEADALEICRLCDLAACSSCPVEAEVTSHDVQQRGSIAAQQ